jgi:DNA-binding IclR family transcriptional regulator
MMEDADFLPFHATASGAAVLAHHPDPEPLIAAAPDPETLRARIAEARAKGHAETLSTFEKDVHSLRRPAVRRHRHLHRRACRRRRRPPHDPRPARHHHP